MSFLPQISGQELAKALQKKGFALDRQSGSHLVFVRTDPWSMVVVPNHRVVDKGTLRAILRQADVSVEELKELL